MDKIFESVAFVSIIAMFSVVLIQVFARFFLPKAPSWTEEIARFFFVGGIAFAAPLGIRSKEFVIVDVIINKLPKKIALLFEIVINICVTIFIWIVAINAVEFVKLGSMQKASTVNVPMSIPFASILIACIFIGVYCVLQSINSIKELRKGGSSK